MKYIKFIFILLLHFSLVQLTVAQSVATDENGRETGSTPSASADIEEPAQINQDDMTKGHDFDDPNAKPIEPTSDWLLPNDLEEMQAEISAAGIISNKNIQTRLIAMEEELNALRQYNELLRLENRSIRRSLGSCCTEIKDGMTASDAYLLQNAPNPFNGSADIQYFIPDGIENAKLEVRDLKGILLESFAISEAGMGKITLDAKEVSNGTYLYSLIINGEIIDSKVMILAK